MTMQHRRAAKSSSASSASSGAALSVNVTPATSCSTATISWDASKGTGPWTIMVAAINQTPITISVPNASGSNAQVKWDVPNYSGRASIDTLIAVSDATGAISGVSSKVSVAPSTSSCAGPSSALDFVWFPTSNSASISQCEDWSISWQKDSGNSGIVSPVTFTFLPENGTPLTVSAGSTNADGGRFTFTVPWDQGTQFAAIANDAGKAGTGGVGDLYTVTSGKGTCSAATNIGNGLPSPQSTLSAIASSVTSSSAAPSSTKTKSSSTPKSSTSSGSAFPNQATTATSSGSHVGVGVGATFGVLAALGMIFGLIWFLKKRSRASASPFEKSTDQQNISPWRWSASPYEAPVTNSRASKWLGKASVIAPSKGFKSLTEWGNQGGSNSNGYAGGPMEANTHTRNRSSLSQGRSEQAYGLQQGSNFRNVVPDSALFPPPRQMNPSEDTSFDNSTTMGDYSAEYHQRTSIPPPKRKPVSAGNDAYPDYYTGEISPSRSNTSDPFSHSAGVDQNVVTHEIQRGQQSYGYAPGVTSEVMMPVGSYRNAPHNTRVTPSNNDNRLSRQSDEGLPYL